MIQVTNEEKVINNIAVNVKEIKLLGLKIYSRIDTTTNNSIVKNLIGISKSKKIKGFSHENKN